MLLLSSIVAPHAASPDSEPDGAGRRGPPSAGGRALLRLSLIASLCLLAGACRPAPPLVRPPAGPGTLRIACTFEKGYVSVIPTAAFASVEDYLMQALIGFREDPAFWRKEAEYRHLEPYAARPCAPGGTVFELPAGRYVVVAGWAGRYEVQGKYKDNGFIRTLDLEPGRDAALTLTPAEMKHTWNCISCPFLAVLHGGRFVEHGHVLSERYTRGRRGTDVRRARADVRSGRVRLRISEREPEVTHLDAVEVWLGGQRLRPENAPDALRAADGQVLRLHLGESIELTFAAPGVPDGEAEVEIRVTGHYEPLVHL